MKRPAQRPFLVQWLPRHSYLCSVVQYILYDTAYIHKEGKEGIKKPAVLSGWFFIYITYLDSPNKVLSAKYRGIANSLYFG